MILYVLSSASFTSCLEFVPKSIISSLERLVVCPFRHPVYIISPPIGVLPRVPTVLHLHVALDDDFTRQLANCDENYKFLVFSCSIL